MSVSAKCPLHGENRPGSARVDAPEPCRHAVHQTIFSENLGMFMLLLGSVPGETQLALSFSITFSGTRLGFGAGDELGLRKV